MNTTLHMGVESAESRSSFWRSYTRYVERTFDVELCQDEEGWWVVECPSLPGCLSQGRTEDEALANIEDAIRLCLEARREMGLAETVIRRQVKLIA